MRKPFPNRLLITICLRRILIPHYSPEISGDWNHSLWTPLDKHRQFQGFISQNVRGANPWISGPFLFLYVTVTSSFLGISRCFPHMNTFDNEPLGDPQPQATHEVVVELHGAHLFSEGDGVNEANFLFLTDKTGVMLRRGVQITSPYPNAQNIVGHHVVTTRLAWHP